MSLDDHLENRLASQTKRRKNVAQKRAEIDWVGQLTPVLSIFVYCEAFDDHDIPGRRELQSLTHRQVIRDRLDKAHLIGCKQCVDVFFVIYPNTGRNHVINKRDAANGPQELIELVLTQRKRPSLEFRS